MKLFHKMEWKDRCKLFDKWDNEKYSWFSKVLLFEEHPEILPKSVYQEVHREFARRLTTTEDVEWETFSKFYKEVDDYRERFEKKNDEKNLRLLLEYDLFVQECEKKYLSA